MRSAMPRQQTPGFQPAGFAAGIVTALTMVAMALATPGYAQETRVGVDLFRGPVVASPRIIGLGGAYLGVAEGVQGMGVNVASLANRYPYSLDWFDWDFTLDWLSLLPGASVDVDNDGQGVGDESYMALNGGLSFLFGSLGTGVWVSGDTITLESDEERVTYSFVRTAVGLTYAFFEQDIVLGAALTSANLEVIAERKATEGAEESDWMSDGDADWSRPGGQFSALWRPHGLPIRIGLDARLPISVTALDGETAAELSAGLPEEVRLPWRIGLGASWRHSAAGYQYNQRLKDPSNPYRRWQEEREAGRVGHLDRRFLLIAMDLVLHGPSKEGYVAPGTYAAGATTVSGQRPALAIHLGVESEVWNNRLVLRGGTYLEPARIEQSSPRLHGTFGLDVRLFNLWRWPIRAGASIDGARDYVNWGVGLGFWH